MLVPDRAPDAHRRTKAITARSRSASTPAARLLASKSLIMRIYDGQPHQPLAELALELYANGRLIEEGGLTSQALGHVAGALSYSDKYKAAEEALSRGRDEARRIGWVTWFAAACQLRARQRLWTGTIPDAVADAATAVEIFSSGQQMYLPASAYCLARADRERPHRRGRRRARDGRARRPADRDVRRLADRWIPLMADRPRRGTVLAMTSTGSNTAITGGSYRRLDPGVRHWGWP